MRKTVKQWAVSALCASALYVLYLQALPACSGSSSSPTYEGCPYLYDGGQSCNGKCLSLVDDSNCGACGVTCDKSAPCGAQTCVATSGYPACRATSPAAIGTPCPGGTCDGKGACAPTQPSSDAGQDAPSDASADSATDAPADSPSDSPADSPSDAGSAWTLTTKGTNDLFSVWASAANDVYVVGDQGTAFHSADNGTTWQPVSIGASNAEILWDIWGTSATNIYVVSSAAATGKIYRYDGVSWGALAASTQGGGAVWGSGPNDIYVVGLGGVILHSTDGTTFNPQTSGTTNNILAVWGSGPNDVYVAGGAGGIAGFILHNDGSGTWTPQSSGVAVSDSLNAIWGPGGSTVYVSDLQKGSLIKTTTGGASWGAGPTSPAGTVGFYDIWGTGASNFYAVGATASGGIIAHSDGSTMSAEPASNAGGGFTGIFGTSATNVYVVGSAGAIAHKTK